MRSLSATEAARHFSQLLDEVEHERAIFTVMRRGRAVARISPAPVGSGAALRDLIRTNPPDNNWPADLRQLREGVQPEERSWNA